MEKGNEQAADSTPAESSFVSVVSESLMSYFESLPKKIIRRLLNDRQITDFMDDHEDQVFTQKMVTSKYVDVWTWTLRIRVDIWPVVSDVGFFAVAK